MSREESTHWPGLAWGVPAVSLSPCVTEAIRPPDAPLQTGLCCGPGKISSQGRWTLRSPDGAGAGLTHLKAPE